MIPLHKVLIAGDALEKIGKTLHSGMITEADRVKEFEALLTEYFGVQVLTMNSCTSAIDMALHLIGVGDGDQIISTPMTCAASNTHAVLRKAKLIWCDVNKETGCAEPESIARLVTEKTKAIIVVDWGGRPVDCDAIRQVLPRPIPIIQDAAHSFGALSHGMPAHATTHSAEYVAWSFQAIKHLTTGDGGALKVPTDQIERARRLRWFGIDRDTKAKFRFLQDIKEAGFKYHMNDLTASLGIANLPFAKASVYQHRENAAFLLHTLGDCKKIELPPRDSGSSWWFFSLLMEKPFEFIDFAEKRGVAAGPVHGRNDHYTAHGKSDIPLPGVDYYMAHHVAIPCGWWLSQQDLEKIVEVVKEWDAI